MKKLRSRLTAIALLASMSGPVLFGIGAGALANTVATSHHVSPSFVSARSGLATVRVPHPWCPVPTVTC
jgi:hypothetical protein